MNNIRYDMMPGVERVFPPEFAIYIPFFSDKEQKHLKTIESNVNKNSSMMVLKDQMLKILAEIKEPSTMFLFVLSRLLFETGEIETLIHLSYDYDNPAVDVWYARLMLHQGLTDEVLRMIEKIYKDTQKPKIIHLHCTLLLALAQYQKGNREQSDYFLEQLFTEALKTPGVEETEKRIFNDLLLEAHQFHIYQNRYREEIVKLENKIHVALQIAKELEHRNHIGNLYNIYAIILRESGNNEKALEYQKKALNLFNQTGYLRMIGAAKGNLGRIYISQQDFSKAELLLLDALEIFRYLEERRNIAYIERYLGDIHAEQGEIKKAIEKYKNAVAIIEEAGLQETIFYCKLAELYLRGGQTAEFELLLNLIDEILKKDTENIILAYFFYLKGIYEAEKMNIGKADEYLKKAVSITDQIGWGALSVKILISKLHIKLKTIKTLNSNAINDGIELIKQIEPFFKENNRIIEIIELLLLEAILNLLNENEIVVIGGLHQINEYVKRQDKKATRDKLKRRVDEIKKLIKVQSKETKKERVYALLNTYMKEFKLFKLVYTQEQQMIHQTPLALLILHKSGIPLRAYVISKRTVRDQLLFGGFITAVQDLIQELFKDKTTSKTMVISYGNYKILIEQSKHDFSIVIVAARDSFILRRKLHMLVSKLEKTELPKDYYGELEENIRESIDNIVNSMFEEELDISEITEMQSNI